MSATIHNHLIMDCDIMGGLQWDKATIDDSLYKTMSYYLKKNDILSWDINWSINDKDEIFVRIGFITPKQVGFFDWAFPHLDSKNDLADAYDRAMRGI